MKIDEDELKRLSSSLVEITVPALYYFDTARGSILSINLQPPLIAWRTSVKAPNRATSSVVCMQKDREHQQEASPSICHPDYLLRLAPSSAACAYQLERKAEPS